ncbi:hypothetical protein [Corynebacterium singulare]|uniref:Uncharacterized protein n=1 Tax=Corynebacterium singulare TaxID=161899 RepID=A0ABS9PWZ8_9CORY|nr:hypothetical protein [Corynebacterium singulare]MCG7277246.1 hypothetical protein [Corynebacterium singulare]
MTPLEKGAIRHTPTMPHTQHNTARTIKTNQHKKVHWHTIEFSHIITTQPYGTSFDETQYCE